MKNIMMSKELYRRKCTKYQIPPQCVQLWQKQTTKKHRDAPNYENGGTVAYLYNDIHNFSLGHFALSKGLNIKGAYLQCCPKTKTQHEQAEKRQHPHDNQSFCEINALWKSFPVISLHFLLPILRKPRWMCSNWNQIKHKVRPEMFILFLRLHNTMGLLFSR